MRAPVNERDHLRFLACGAVDDGKSTLIGRLMAETGSIPDDQMANLISLSRKFGTTGDNLDYALLLDGLEAEREQGITIDVAYRYFGTKRRKTARRKRRAKAPTLEDIFGQILSGK